MDLVVINTPHQFLQINELKNHFQFDPKNTILLIIGIQPIESFDSVDQSIYLKKIHIITWKLRSPISFIFQYPKFNNIIKEIKKIGLIENLYLSQYYTDSSVLLYNQLKPKRIILSDEGTASFQVAIDRLNLTRHKSKSFIKKIIYMNKMHYPKRIIFFSQYNLDISANDKLIPYKFKQKQNGVDFDKNKVIIIGSSLADVNLLTEEYYIFLLNKIISLEHKSQIIYYAHRKESLNKLKKIDKIVDEIIINEIPFEYFYDRQKLLPNKIISLASPILQNISTKYQLFPELLLYKFDTAKLKYSKNVYDKIYEGYKKNKFVKMIDIK
tara:strand:+ start:494 stop:1471 length:978 start_codon:yes stop_codon:yes gene_type:complete